MESLAPIEFAERLHNEALKIVADYKKCEISLIEILQKIDRSKGYLALKYRSLYHYTTEGLGLSDETSYVLTNIARKAQEVPALKTAIQDGSISISKARRIVPLLDQQNQNHWLELAKTKSKRELEREVAIASPVHAIQDRMTFVHPTAEKPETIQVQHFGQTVRVQLQAGISEQLMADLRRVQDVVSQKLKRTATIEDALKAMTAVYLERNDPIQVATRRAGLKDLPMSLRNKIIFKYQGQCAHVDNQGHRCAERRYLEIHHIRPRSEGGGDEPSNLRLLCSGHHKMQHH